MENKDHIDRHLKDSLLDYKLEPRMDSFENIQTKLRRKKRRRMLFILLPLIGLTTIAGLLLFTPGQQQNTVANQHVNKPQPAAGSEINTHVNEAQVSETASSSVSPPPSSGKNAAPVSTAGIPKQTFNKIIPFTLNEEVVPNEKTEIAMDVETMSAPGRTDLPDSILYLDAHSLLIPVLSRENNIRTDEGTMDLLPIDIAPKKKSRQFYAGLQFSPQLSRFQLMENNNRNLFYDGNSSQAFSAAYLDERKKQNAASYNYNAGLKAGMVLKEKWEFNAGIGYQRWMHKEKTVRLTTQGGGPLLVSPGTASSYWTAPQPTKSNLVDGFASFDQDHFINRYNYIYLSLEAGKMHTLWGRLKIKTSAGLQLNRLRRSAAILVYGPDQYAYSYQTSARNWLTTPFIKAGIIEDLGRRLQFHASPYLFYSVQSMSGKNYVIRQNIYGAGLECMLLIRLGKLNAGQ